MSWFGSFDVVMLMFGWGVCGGLLFVLVLGLLRCVSALWLVGGICLVGCCVRPFLGLWVWRGLLVWWFGSVVWRGGFVLLLSGFS